MPKKATKTKSSVKRTTKPAAKKPATPKKWPRPPVPGLLPTPPEVLVHLERELKDHPVTEVERKRLTDYWTLQYYYGGEGVVYRHVTQGVEVLATGDAIAEFYKNPPVDLHGCIYAGAPDPW